MEWLRGLGGQTYSLTLYLLKKLRRSQFSSTVEFKLIRGRICYLKVHSRIEQSAKSLLQSKLAGFVGSFIPSTCRE